MTNKINILNKKLKGGIKMTIINEIKKWTNEHTEDNKKDFLNELLESDFNDNVLINSINAQEFYNVYSNEINNIMIQDTGHSIEQAMQDRNAFETLINSVGGIDSDLSFKESNKLMKDELIYIVWHSIEHEIEKFLI